MLCTYQTFSKQWSHLGCLFLPSVTYTFRGHSLPVWLYAVVSHTSAETRKCRGWTLLSAGVALLLIIMSCRSRIMRVCVLPWFNLYTSCMEKLIYSNFWLCLSDLMVFFFCFWCCFNWNIHWCTWEPSLVLFYLRFDNSIYHLFNDFLWKLDKCLMRMMRCPVVWSIVENQNVRSLHYGSKLQMRTIRTNFSLFFIWKMTKKKLDIISKINWSFVDSQPSTSVSSPSIFLSWQNSDFSVCSFNFHSQNMLSALSHQISAGLVPLWWKWTGGSWFISWTH